MIEGIIDNDVHPWIGELHKVLPYLEKDWQRRFESRAHLPFMTPMPCRAPHFNMVIKSPNAVAGAGIMKPEHAPPSGGMAGSDPQFIVEHHLDALDLAAAVLLVIEGGMLETWSDPDEAAAIARGLNELMADQWLTVDDRFNMAMSVSPHDPLLAAEEIRRFGGTDGVVGVWLPPIRQPLGHRSFYPIYEACVEMGLPLVIHPTGVEGDFNEGAGYSGGTPGLRIERYCLYSEIVWTNVVSLVFQGVFERFPGLRVAFVEYGFESVPGLIWRMDNVWKTARASAPWVKRSPTEYIRDHVRFSSQPSLIIPEERHHEHVLETIHADRTLIYASDYPHWDAEEVPERVFPKASEELRQRIFRDNARELYGDRLRTRETVPA